MVPAAYNRFLRILIAVLMAGAIALPCRAGNYHIRLDRSYAVGMETQEKLTLETVTAVRRGESNVSKVETQRTILECTVRVLSITGEHWQKIAVTPTSFIFSDMSEDRRFSAIGKTILISRSPTGISFKRKDGQPLQDLDKLLLKRFFVQPPAITADAVFGTTKQVTTGQTWPINKLKLCQKMNLSSKGRIEAAPANVTGDFKAVKVWKHKGAEYLQVGGTIRIDPLKFKSAMFDQLRNRKTAAVLRMSFHVPVKGTGPAARMEQTFEWRVTGDEVQNSRLTPFAMTSQIKQSRIIEIIKNPAEKGN